MNIKRELFLSSIVSTVLILTVVLGYCQNCLGQSALPGDPFSFGGSNGAGQGIGGLPTPGDVSSSLSGQVGQPGKLTVSARIAALNNQQNQATLILQAKVPDGFHLYSITQKSGGPIPTKISVNPGVGFKIGPFFAQTKPKVTPADDPNNYYEMPIEEHAGTVVWTATIETVGAGPAPGTSISGTITYQLCNSETCLEPATVPFSAAFSPALGAASGSPSNPAAEPASESNPSTLNNSGNIGNSTLPGQPTNNPVAPLDPNVSGNPDASGVLPVPTTPVPPEAASNDAANGATSTKAREGLIIYAFMAFLGGLILNVMPCVLPVISLKLMAFIDQAGESRTRVFLLNLWYVAGLMSVFILLAFLSTYGLSIFTGSFSSEHAMGWGEMFSYMPVQVGMCALIFLMALSLLGVWEIPIPGFVGTGAINDVQQKEGAIGAFTKGIFTTILAVPCVGPFLAPVLGAVIGQPISFTLLIFCMIGLGMGTPYILVGLFPELLAFLPKPGRWMVTVREFMGFLLLATVVYFFHMIPEEYAVPTLAMLFSLWFMCWIVNLIPYGASWGRRAWGWGLGLLFAVGISWGMFAWFAYETEFPWDKEFSPARIAEAQKEGRVVMIDFTANWCPNCKANLYTAIQTRAVEKIVRAKNVYAVLADYTNYSPEIKKALLSYNRQAIPLLVVLPADGRAPILLDGLITRKMVVNALNTATTGAKQPAAQAADAPDDSSSEKSERSTAMREQLRSGCAVAIMTRGVTLPDGDYSTTPATPAGSTPVRNAGSNGFSAGVSYTDPQDKTK